MQGSRLNTEPNNIKNIFKDKILFQVSKHANFRMAERDITPSKLDEYISNVNESDDWHIWLGLHTNQEGWFDLYLQNERKYMIYDPKTKITCLMFFHKIKISSTREELRRIKIVTIFHGRPVGQSKQNIKKNKFYKFKVPDSIVYRAQVRDHKIPYYDLRQGIKESTP
tara:strand:- start:132 stop:635 length:504 start_codon:yes stop_codon:yes gene_type:complete